VAACEIGFDERPREMSGRTACEVYNRLKRCPPEHRRGATNSLRRAGNDNGPGCHDNPDSFARGTSRVVLFLENPIDHSFSTALSASIWEAKTIVHFHCYHTFF
jgi:hypothetical protein